MTATRFALSRGLLGLQYDQINESESESESVVSLSCFSLFFTTDRCGSVLVSIVGHTVVHGSIPAPNMLH